MVIETLNKQFEYIKEERLENIINLNFEDLKEELNFIVNALTKLKDGYEYKLKRTHENKRLIIIILKQKIAEINFCLNDIENNVELPIKPETEEEWEDYLEEPFGNLTDEEINNLKKEFFEDKIIEFYQSLKEVFKFINL